ncbi:MAG: hypothetical protein DSM107014_03665 [Gomphosphaeria aponina SAG 52.96 = DSM 107014]|uniref:Uncharacterized protein n=1 Tax=Gomphosphaeria aponina SAG 52.96 = DSM 107014 TaxID=1521640 RepID=A0A941GS32_9CHRO|nr:hypothetical protein [Gomphosphaeria aponina SAG 52.96 = DSM 107014]
MGLNFKYLIITILVGVIILLVNVAANAGSGNITEAQFNSGRACEAIAKSVAYVLHLPAEAVSFQGNSDNPDGSYLCFVTKGNEILVRMVADANGNWGEPY